MPSHRLLGLHHVTATVDDAQEDLDFCLDALGLRLVKRTVNFDNHNVYHFYYGDERGTPGTIWTTFPYRGWGVPVGRKGAGQVTVTSFSVPKGSLDAWQGHLARHRVTAAETDPRFGERTLTFEDPSGLGFELVEVAADPRTPWTAGGVGAEAAIRGLHSVTMLIPEPGDTLELMTSLLGFSVAGEEAGRTRLAVGGSGPGHVVDIAHSFDPGPAMNGLGTVHHVAFAIGSPAEQLALREDLLAHGVRVTEVRDRQYFQSIYFRTPGGVLFEVATVAPGFAVDEPLASLGQSLKLPPWEEVDRPGIERGLPRVTR
jgi:glyoxalase family protein